MPNNMTSKVMTFAFAAVIGASFAAAPANPLNAMDDAGTLLGVLLGQVPADVLDLDSEGQASVGGYATISPMDGNWSSDGNFFLGRSVRYRLKGVLSAE